LVAVVGKLADTNGREKEESKIEMNSRRARSLTDYLRAARRRKLALFIPALVLAIATGAALRDLPDLYESRAGMAITPLKTDGVTEFSGRLNGFRQQVTGRESLEAIIRKCKLKDEPSAALVSQMRDRIAIEPDASRYSQPAAFTISYRATDPETARNVTDELADRLVGLSPAEPSAPALEAEVLRNRAAEVSIQLRELEEKDPRLLGASSDLSVVTLSQPARIFQVSPEAVRAQQMSIESLKDQQYKIQQQLADVDRRCATQRQIVEQQKRSPTLRDDPTYAVLIAKRTELQGQRDTLINRQELTDKHPRILAINDQIAAINRQIEELRQQDSTRVSQSPEARELAALESERNRLRIDLEVTGRELARRSASPPVQAVAPESTPARPSAVAPKLAQEYFGLKRSYNELTSSLQDSEDKLKRAGPASLVQVRVLEPATLPERPVSPNRPLFISVAAAVGLALGAMFAFFAESGRFRALQDARDVEYYTRLPLLAAIPRTATMSERRRAFWRAKARLAVATAMSVAATFGLTKIFIATDILALLIKK
jgi:uncharacterized protein involved in exopolysaccharide biosynthesis